MNETRFVDAIDPHDYKSVDYLLHDAIADGFREFEMLWGYPNRVEMNGEEERMGFAPVAYAWSLCRYFRDLAESDKSEFFLHDDMYGRPLRHFRVTSRLIRDIYNYPILEGQCRSKNVEFVCFLLNTQSVGLPPIQLNVFEEFAVGTDRLNLKAGFYSAYGASLILERLRHQISLGKRTPLGLLQSLESVEGWNPRGVFSTVEPLFVEYPDSFLGSDIRGVPPLQGHLGKLFSEVKPS